MGRVWRLDLNELSSHLVVTAVCRAGLWNDGRIACFSGPFLFQECARNPGTIRKFGSYMADGLVDSTGIPPRPPARLCLVGQGGSQLTRE
jgi:hypothetical protein